MPEQPGPRYVVEQTSDGRWLVVDRGDDRRGRHAVDDPYDDEELARLDADALSNGEDLLDWTESARASKQASDPDSSWWNHAHALAADLSDSIDAQHNSNELLAARPQDHAGLIGRQWLDAFRNSLAGAPAPAGYDHWGYSVVRVDYTAGGSLVWPSTDGVVVEPGEHTDGFRGGRTRPGVLAIASDWHHVAATTDVGGSILLTLAYRDADVVDASDNDTSANLAGSRLVFLRRALLVDADTGGFNLKALAGRDIRDLHSTRTDWLFTADVEALQATERVSFLGPEPLQPPGLDTRVRTRLPIEEGDWLRQAVARYRQPGYTAAHVANALAHLADGPATDGFATATVQAGVLRAGLPWAQQVAIQRRLDGYLLGEFGRVDPRVEQPERAMDAVEQWLHLYPYGTEFLNIAETVIELDLLVDDLIDPNALVFTQKLLQRGRVEHGWARFPGPVLRPGPTYILLPGAGTENG